ncbi:MAG: Beta/Gamma crystallin [Actinomycetota bacterium]|nr:Beta/Gamma crystallin [Actinomycetota bacterium]
MRTKFLGKISAAAALTVVLTCGLPSASAFAINRVDAGCYPGSDFLVINTDSSTLCYANAGTKSVTIKKVNNVSSGNNVVEFRQHYGAFYHTRKMGKFQLWLCDPQCTISRIKIK